MTALEKQVQVKDVLYHMCGYGEGCEDCRFFNPEDETDGEFFCAIRDKEGLIPLSHSWHMESAMLNN